MDKDEAIVIAKRFAELLRGRFPVARILLFGSHAHGNVHDDSDIDIAVFVDEPIADIYQAAVELFRLRRQIDSRIEPILITPESSEPEFAAHIEQEGVRVI